MIEQLLNLNIADKIATAIGRVKRKPVILCIGSDRVTGDSLGPLVGHLLGSTDFSAYIYGSLNSPVTALNLAEVLATINARHAGSKIIAIDSSVGQQCQLGLISVFRGSLCPGAADGKNLPRVGDISITATVAACSANNLYSVRLGFVYDLAKTIAESLYRAINPLARCCSA